MILGKSPWINKKNEEFSLDQIKRLMNCNKTFEFSDKINEKDEINFF